MVLIMFAILQEYTTGLESEKKFHTFSFIRFQVFTFGHRISTNQILTNLSLICIMYYNTTLGQWDKKFN